MPGLILDSQYLPLTACPSLALISLHVSAGSSGMEPRATGKKKNDAILMSLMALYETTSFHVAARLTTKKTTHDKKNNFITTTAGFITSLCFHPQISFGYSRRLETIITTPTQVRRYHGKTSEDFLVHDRRYQKISKGTSLYVTKHHPRSSDDY